MGSIKAKLNMKPKRGQVQSDKWVMKLESVGDATVLKDREFQRGIVPGKNEF